MRILGSHERNVVERLDGLPVERRRLAVRGGAQFCGVVPQDVDAQQVAVHEPEGAPQLVDRKLLDVPTVGEAEAEERAVGGVDRLEDAR